jgi:hypothetical protein
MVFRYQELLREDDDLVRRLARLQASPRRFLPFALAALCITFFVTAALVHDWVRVVPLVFGCATAVGLPIEFMNERRIVQRWSSSIGTVLSRWRTGRRYEVRIKYAFRAADRQIYVGKASGGVGLPNDRETLAIIYNSDDPSRNLPLSRFVFYEFSCPPYSLGVQATPEANANQGQPS